MLTISTDPYPQSVMPKADEAAEKAGEEEPEPHLSSVQNGVEAVVVGDRDEVMTDVEEAEIDDEMTIDMEAFEEIVGSSEPKSEIAADS
jgi:serine/threonine-protein phosphatase 4 regulatory subunit 2